jgi:hypothetical protein
MLRSQKSTVHFMFPSILYNNAVAALTLILPVSDLQWYAPIKIIDIKIIVPIISKKSLRLMVHISKTLTKSLR